QSVRVWNTWTGQEHSQVNGGRLHWQANPWSKDGESLWSQVSDSAPFMEYFPRVFDRTTGTVVLAPRPSNQPFEAISWSPEGRRLATLENGTIKVWHLPRPSAGLANGMWSPDSRHQVAASSQEQSGNGTVLVKDTVTGETLSYEGHVGGGPLGTAAWSRD